MASTKLKFDDLHEQAFRLNYRLYRNVRDNKRYRWAYASYPSGTGGPISYFASLEDVAAWLKQVEKNRQN